MVPGDSLRRSGCRRLLSESDKRRQRAHNRLLPLPAPLAGQQLPQNQRPPAVPDTLRHPSGHNRRLLPHHGRLPHRQHEERPWRNPRHPKTGNRDF